MVNDPHSQHQEPTVLDYARFHGIAKDYLTEGPPRPDELPRAPPFLRQELVDPPNAAKIEWPRDFRSQHERLEIDILGARALNCACRAPPLPSEPEDAIEGKLHRTRKWKVELPILLSDNELDMKRFVRREEMVLSSFAFPLEDVDDENDGGLAWPKKFWERLEQMRKCMDSEKLRMARADFVYLQACLKDDFSKEDQELAVDQALKEADDKANKVKAHTRLPFRSADSFKKLFPEPVTPPLLPLDPPLNPFPDPRSSSPTNQIQYTSSDNNSAVAEAQALEEQLTSRDTLIPPKQTAHYDPMLYDEPDAELLDIFSNMTCDPSSRKRKAAVLRVEVPLTPLSIEKKPKTVAFADNLTQLIAPRPVSTTKHEEALPSDFLHADDKMEDDSDFDAFFRDEVAPIADKVAQRTEQEKLSEVDTVRRVDVSLMDFSLPVSPWEIFGKAELNAQKQLLRQCAREELSVAPMCQTESLDDKMRWNPFTQQSAKAKAISDEVIRYEKDLAAFMAKIRLQDVVKPEDLAWKPDGLRVLDDIDEDEEDLECGCFSPGDDIGALVRKRKMDMQEPEATNEPEKKQQHTSRPQSRPAGLEADFQERVKRGILAPTPTQPPTTSIFGSIFSASTSLSSFMKVHSGITTTQPEPACPEPAEASLQPQPELSRPLSPALESKKATLIPLPEAKTPASYIISTHLSTHQRSLTSKIQSLYPSATLIERAPLAILPSPLFTNKPPKQPAQHEPLPAILLAPGTALLLPTFTTLAQRPLPGAQPSPTTFFPLQLARVAQRCERVFVGVWRGAHSAPTAAAPPLSSAEALAFAEISGHAARLESAVDVVLVPGGEGAADEEEALARWIVRLMARFAQQQQHHSPEQQRRAEREERVEGQDSAVTGRLKLLQDETLWEQVLRRAGMDAFAAQVVLDALKKKGDEGQGDDEETSREAGGSGLAAFVRMSREERVVRFGAIMGGRRVLDRVGQVLDQGWVCVGEGMFRG
ncbi:uncharacterized protein J3D65DRAFT_621026 [Phyllosticta citribraziliensis]|uniref:Uncharacterized protein n=1 Tax=Phyllosticta citribraziliensis TaxID=989973 RepID=A0ABR1LSI0_9PEZI